MKHVTQKNRDGQVWAKGHFRQRNYQLEIKGSQHTRMMDVLLYRAWKN
jgi:hypothetical protein